MSENTSKPIRLLLADDEEDLVTVRKRSRRPPK